MDFLIGAVVVTIVLWQLGLLGPLINLFWVVEYHLYSRQFPSDNVRSLRKLMDTRSYEALSQKIITSAPIDLVDYSRLLKGADRKVLEKCAELYPDEAHILAAYAQSLIVHAWDARGGGRANTVSTEGARTFFDALTVADKVLRTALTVNPNIAFTYDLMITVQMGLSHRDVAAEYFRTAKTKFPNDLKIHLAMLKLLNARWFWKGVACCPQ